MTTTWFALIPHPLEPKALILPRGEGWTLPYYRADKGPETLHIFNQAIQDQWGLDVLVQQRTGPPHVLTDTDRVQFFVMENAGSDRLPPEAYWVDADDLDTLPDLEPLLQDALRVWFDEVQSGERSRLRSPWAHPGWHYEVMAWIKKQLAIQGISIISAIEQVRSWSITSILRVPTSRGNYFFKASHPTMFPHEASLTQFLSEHYPMHVPKVLAADEKRNWLLMEGFQGEFLRNIPDLSRWEEAIRLFAQVQVESVAQIDDLLALGCPDRRLHHLSEQMVELLADETIIQIDPEHQFSPSQIGALQGLRPQLEEMIETLAAYNLPPALLHGDLHPDNIVVTEAGLLFFDWSDGAVAPPFFELLTTLEDVDTLTKKTEEQAALRQVYLEFWTPYASMDRLEAAYALSQKLLPLYHALSYRWIMLHTEPRARWELGGGVSFFLKRLLHGFGIENSQLEAN